MIRTLAVVAAVAGVVMTGGLAQGQTSPRAAEPQKSPGLLGDQQLVEGTIKSVHAHGIVLEDGTSLIVPASLEFNRGDLKPGATVKANYEERAGKKFTTTLSLEPRSPR
jgi:uncharacterized protein DUF1344